VQFNCNNLKMTCKQKVDHLFKEALCASVEL
jgi:hypothetical protein